MISRRYDGKRLLPNIHPILRSHKHRIALLDIKCFIEGLDITQSRVHTPFAQRVRIDLREAQDLLLTDVLSPKRRIAQVETLVVSKAIDRRGRLLAGEAVLVSLISDQQTTLVGDVLTQRITSVSVNRISHDDGVVLLNQDIGVHQFCKLPSLS